MDEDGVRGLYDATYAAVYDERFLTGAPWAAHGAEFEVEVLGELLTAHPGRWLDVACGTGWFLGHFPDAERTGLDLSPAMLERAATANPGIDLVEGSYLEPHPAWTDAWALVSCMWFAYGYVDTVRQVDAVVANLARWTAPDGACFVPVCDLEDLSGGTDVPYLNPDTWTFGGPLRITAFVWSWTDEPYGKHHDSLVCPHLDHMVAAFGHWFEEVEVVRYPPFQPGWGTRKAIVARAKRAVGGEGPATVVRTRHEPYRGEEPAEPPVADSTDGPDPSTVAEGATDGSAETDQPGPDPIAALGPMGQLWFRLPEPVRHGAVRAGRYLVPPDRRGRWRRDR